MPLRVEIELQKLRIARGDRLAVGFVQNSGRQCTVVEFTEIGIRHPAVKPPILAFEVIGDGATTVEAFASAWRNSKEHIESAGATFRAGGGNLGVARKSATEARAKPPSEVNPDDPALKRCATCRHWRRAHLDGTDTCGAMVTAGGNSTPCPCHGFLNPHG
jgi:hypothetical protein